MWVPEEFRTVAITLATTGIERGPLYDYVVTSLRAYDALLASMAQLEEEMLDKFEGSTPAPQFGDSTSIAIKRLRETIAGIESGRAEINALLKGLRAKNESEGLVWRSPHA